MNTIVQGHSASLYDMPLRIMYIPTLRCNYRCSYCDQNSCRPQQKDFISKNDTFRLFDNILKLNRPTYAIGILGGEPFTFPYLSDVCEYISDNFKERLLSLTVVSNGSMINICESFAKLSINKQIALIISLHSDHVTVDHINKMTDILSTTTYLRYDLMFNPAKRDYVKHIFSILCKLREKYPFAMCIQTIRDTTKGQIVDSRYTNEDFHWQMQAQKEFDAIASAGPSLRAFYGDFNGVRYNGAVKQDYIYEHLGDMNIAYQQGKYNLRDIYCVAGTGTIVINPDGHISSSACAMQMRSKSPGYIESPYETPGFAHVVKCSVTCCGCRANDYLPKFASKQEAEDFLMQFNIKQKRLIEEGEKAVAMKQKINFQQSLLDFLLKGIPPAECLVDEKFYFSRYPDVAASGMSAAEHYRSYGHSEGRSPNIWFNQD